MYFIILWIFFTLDVIQKMFLNVLNIFNPCMSAEWLEAAESS